MDVIGQCPACHDGGVIEMKKSYSCFKDGCKFVIWKNAFVKLGMANLDVTTIRQLLKGETVILCLKSPKTGKEFDAPVKIAYDDTWGWGLKIVFEK